jgi:hypothetical protein
VIIAPGSVQISADVFFADDSGAAVTGKVATDFPACAWSGGGNTADTPIVLTDLPSIVTSHPNNNVAGGVKEREGGIYRLDLPNNMFALAGRRTLTFAETTGKRILAPTYDVQFVPSYLINAADSQAILTLMASLQTLVGGAGPVLVDHNYGGTNNLQYTDPQGSGIEGAVIQAFRLADFNAGRRSATYIVGQSTTDINGHWILPMAMAPGAYMLVATKIGTVGGSGSFGPHFTPLTVVV